MSSTNVDDLAAALESTRVTPSGVSFAGKSLKLDSEEDAQQICDEMDKCEDLEYLNLEGNTLGVAACKGISKALEKHPEFKRALWKDMFTGRMKTEIPKALDSLGRGLVTAGAQLTELDLSDNAFGPIGVNGLAALLKSSSCFALEELRLNNNGLGITGGRLLASALTECYNVSKKQGKALALRVFVAGRNRLENEGAKALAAVFKMIGTLEELSMPQNGIYHEGITALSEALIHNKNLRILNLNDNTIGDRGAEAFAKVLPELQNLRHINFGDCLLKTKGAVFLGNGLRKGHDELEELMLGHNEIRIKGAMRIVSAVSNKTKLKTLNLNGNQFGNGGISTIKDALRDMGKLNTLGSFSDDDSEESEPESDDYDVEPADEEEENSEVEEGEAENGGVKIVELKTVEEFLKVPTAENFMLLGEERTKLLLEAAKGNQISIDTFVPVLMKVSSLSRESKKDVAKLASQCAEELCKELFAWSEKSDNSSLVNNTLLVNLKLIKSEDKQFRPTWNVDSCTYFLKQTVDKAFVPESIKGVLKFFIEKAEKART